MASDNVIPVISDTEEESITKTNTTQTTPFAGPTNIPKKTETLANTKQNPIVISKSPDNPSKGNDYLTQNKVIYVFINCKKSLFSYD